VNGRWVNVPVDDFLDTLFRLKPTLPVIAEDLGLITPDVREIITRYDLTNMKVPLFAFDGESARHPYIPHNVPPNCVYYTGTHDNNTVRGFFETEASPETWRRAHDYIGRNVPLEEMPREFMRLVMMSTASMAIFPLQDVLGLGASARMNTPGTAVGNWRWRFEPSPQSDDAFTLCRHMTRLYGRG